MGEIILNIEDEKIENAIKKSIEGDINRLVLETLEDKKTDIENEIIRNLFNRLLELSFIKRVSRIIEKSIKSKLLQDNELKNFLNEIVRIKVDELYRDTQETLIKR